MGRVVAVVVGADGRVVAVAGLVGGDVEVVAAEAAVEVVGGAGGVVSGTVDVVDEATGVAAPRTTPDPQPARRAPPSNKATTML